MLGLPPTASPEQVKAAYRTAARKVHPDTATGDEAAFKSLAAAAEQALAYARGTERNPYLPSEDHILYVADYDRHSHAPSPPPNIWRTAGLFWILPVAGVIFMVSGATGTYFLPVFAISMTLFGAVVWLVRRSQTQQPRPADQHEGDTEEDQPRP